MPNRIRSAGNATLGVGQLAFMLGLIGGALSTLPWLADVKPGSPQHLKFGFGELVIPRGRRRGQPILRNSYKNWPGY
jgi:hypothetical protein